MEGDRDRDYDAAGFGHRLGFGKSPALLVIDLNKGMTASESPLAMRLDNVVAATVQLLAAARRNDVPVFFTTNRYAKGCWDAGIRLRKIPSLKIYEDGSTFSQIDDRVRPLTEEPLIEKRFSSAFWETGLASVLVSKGIDTVIIAGTATSGCVRASAMDCVNFGFHTIVVREAVGDRSASAHEQSLYDIDKKMADVEPVETVIAYFRGFRAVEP